MCKLKQQSMFTKMKNKPILFKLYSLILLYVSLTCSAQCSYTLKDILDKVMYNSPGFQLYKIQTEIDKRTYEINIASLNPSISASFSGPSYSQTISPISQPDGSIKYLQINNLQSTFSLNTIVPIELTGGQLLLNSNLSMYKNNSAYNASTSYSLNYYRLSYSQPLDFFSINKWNRQIAKANRSKAEIEQTEYIFDLKHKTLQLFFNIIQKRSNIKQLKHQKLSLQKLYTLSKIAYTTGRMLETDLESIALKILSYENQIKIKGEELKKLFNLLSIETNLDFIPEEDNFICPEPPVFTIDTEFAIFRLNDKIESLYKSQLLSQQRTSSQLKHRRWGNASLSMGIGLNASSEDLKGLYRNKTSDYNVSFNYSYPLTSWSSQKKEYEQSKLTHKKTLINKQRYTEEQKVELLDLISTLELNNETYSYLQRQKQLLQNEERIKTNLFQAQHIIFKELEEIIDQQIQNEQNIIQTIANAYLNICQIEKMILTNILFVSATEYDRLKLWRDD